MTSERYFLYCCITVEDMTFERTARIKNLDILNTKEILMQILCSLKYELNEFKEIANAIPVGVQILTNKIQPASHLRYFYLNMNENLKKKFCDKYFNETFISSLLTDVHLHNLDSLNKCKEIQLHFMNYEMSGIKNAIEKEEQLLKKHAESSNTCAVSSAMSTDELASSMSAKIYLILRQVAVRKSHTMKINYLKEMTKCGIKETLGALLYNFFHQKLCSARRKKDNLHFSMQLLMTEEGERHKVPITPIRYFIIPPTEIPSPLERIYGHDKKISNLIDEMFSTAAERILAAKKSKREKLKRKIDEEEEKSLLQPIEKKPFLQNKYEENEYEESVNEYETDEEEFENKEKHVSKQTMSDIQEETSGVSSEKNTKLTPEEEEKIMGLIEEIESAAQYEAIKQNINDVSNKTEGDKQTMSEIEEETSGVSSEKNTKLTPEEEEKIMGLIEEIESAAEYEALKQNINDGSNADRHL